MHIQNFFSACMLTFLLAKYGLLRREMLVENFK